MVAASLKKKDAKFMAYLAPTIPTDSRDWHPVNAVANVVQLATFQAGIDRNDEHRLTTDVILVAPDVFIIGMVCKAGQLANALVQLDTDPVFVMAPTEVRAGQLSAKLESTVHAWRL